MNWISFSVKICVFVNLGPGPMGRAHGPGPWAGPMGPWAGPMGPGPWAGPMGPGPGPTNSWSKFGEFLSEFGDFF